MNVKKISLLLSSLLLAPLTALAVSVTEIHDNPDQYVLVDKNSESEFYVDSYSIASLRYDPPYYAMSCDTYLISYTHSFIEKITLTATYDYNRSLTTLMNNERKLRPNESAHDLALKVANEMLINNGLTGYWGSGEDWDLDGNYLRSFANAGCPTDKVGLNSPEYQAINYMFYKGYNEYFLPKFDSKHLY